MGEDPRISGRSSRSSWRSSHNFLEKVLEVMEDVLKTTARSFHNFWNKFLELLNIVPGKGFRTSGSSSHIFLPELLGEFTIPSWRSCRNFWMKFLKLPRDDSTISGRSFQNFWEILSFGDMLPEILGELIWAQNLWKKFSELLGEASRTSGCSSQKFREKFSEFSSELRG